MPRPGREVGRPHSKTADPVPSVTRGRERGLERAVCAVSRAGGRGGGKEGSSGSTVFGFVRR